MKAIKYLISILFILSTNIVCGQDELEIKLDSIEEIIVGKVIIRLMQKMVF